MSGQAISAYKDYKGSGAFWLGDIPEDWSCRQLKYVANLSTEKLIPSACVRYVGMENIRSGDGSFVVTAEQEPEGLSLSFENGDVLFGKLRPYLAKSWLASFSGICSSEFLVLGARKVSPRFLNYTTLSREFISVVDSSTYGAKMPRASWDFIGMLKVPVPDFGTSVQIAKFLDYETAKIDALIDKQQQLIALLKEKRQAVISHAVTKGLNPDAPMRDSGVEWLGEVPAHWGCLRIGVLFSESSTRATAPKELALPILSVSIHHGISDRELNAEELDRKVARSEDRSLYKTVRENDLAYNMMRAWQGGFGAATIPGLISPAYVVCEPKFDLCSKYFELVLRTGSAVVELKRFSRGITDFRLRLYWDDFKNIQVPIPPRGEMNEIIENVEVIGRKYENLANAAEVQIELLQERRTALISAAVTGKIDVRDWKPRRSG